jgi:hypothetical protein
MVTLKMKIIQKYEKKEGKESEKPRFYGQNKLLLPYLLVLGQFQPHGCT